MATTLNRTVYGGSTAPGSGVYPEDVKILKVFANYAETDYDPLASSDTSVYIPTVDKHQYDDGNIVSIIDRVLAAGGSPIVKKLGAEFIYASGDASEYKFVNVSGDNITEMTINRSTGTVTTRNCFLDSSEVEAGDSSITVQKTVDPNTGAETFAVSVTEEGITNNKIADATIESEKLAKKKQISVDGVTMTNEEFWSQLRSLIDPKTTTSVKAISSLFSTATKENLSLLVVLQDDTLQSLSANDLTFAYCATNRQDPVPTGCVIVETELNDFFFQLIDSGYNGIGFLMGGAFIGIEWSDLMLPYINRKQLEASK